MMERTLKCHLVIDTFVYEKKYLDNMGQTLGFSF